MHRPCAGIGDNIDDYPSYPASYSNANIIAVASITSAGDRSTWSNYGVKSVDIGGQAAGALVALARWAALTHSHGAGAGAAGSAGAAAPLAIQPAWHNRPPLLAGAPGSGIYSTVPSAYRSKNKIVYTSSYATYSGTSSERAGGAAAGSD